MNELSRERQVESILHAYLQAIDAGQKPDRAELLRRHPDLADDLREFFADQEKMDQFAKSMHNAQVGAATIGADGSADTENALRTRSFGDYELLGEIARGGMGIVYKARQISLNRVVALKMILTGQLASPADVQRFRTEAEAAGHLDHPNIVPIYEIGEHDGHQYFSMKLVEGGNLAAKMSALVNDSEKAVKTLISVARAVHYAHQRGILHRDLKPTNILLDARGEPLVSDFGLAKRVEGGSDVTRSGTILGTPSYMAPEQATAQKVLSTAADVYSLGAILFELLTGQPPFKAETPLEMLVKVVEHEADRPSTVKAGVDRDLETICLKCLEKDPRKRFSSAEAFADDLERWLTGKPILARPTSTTERLMKWSKRQPVLAGALGTVATAAIGLLVLAGFLWRNAELRAEAVQNLDEAKVKLVNIGGELKDVDEKRKQADAKRKQAEADREQASKLADEQRKIAVAQALLAKQQKALADEIEAEVKRLRGEADIAHKQLDAVRVEAGRTLYAADMQLAHAAWQTENYTSVSDLLKRYQKPAGDDPRGFEWHYLWRRAHAARREWNAQDQPSLFHPIRSLAVAPDGTMAATWDERQQIRLWNTRDGKLIRSIECGKGASVAGLAFGDQGRKLLAAILWDKDFGAGKVIAAVKRRDPFDWVLLKDRLELRTWSVTENRPPQVDPFDLTRTPLSLIDAMNGGGGWIQHDGESMGIFGLDISADRKLAAFVGQAARIDEPTKEVRFANTGGRLIVWDIAKARVHALQNAPTPVTAVAFSPDGKRLAIGNSDGVVGIGTPEADQPPRLCVAHRGFVGALRFSRDGTRLFSGAWDGHVIEWDVASGKEITRRRGHTAAVLRLDLSADGQTLVSGGEDGSIKVWDLGRTHDPLVLHGHSVQILALAFAEKSRELTSVDRNGIVKTWSALDGKLLRDTIADQGKKGEKPSPGYARIGIGNDQLAFSPDGKNVIWRSGQHGFKARNLGTSKETEFLWNESLLVALAVSPDNQWIAAGNLLSGRAGAAGAFAVWNAVDGKHAATFFEKGPTRGLAFSADGKRLIAAHESGVILWDWQANQLQRLEPRSVMNLVAVSQDGKWLAGATGGAVGRQAVVRIWDLKANELKVEFRGAGSQVRHLIFSPDGRRLATVGDTSSQQSVLKLWDTASGREVFTAVLPPGQVTAVAFSPDGHRLAAAKLASDPTAPLAGRQVPGEIHIWDATPADGKSP